MSNTTHGIAWTQSFLLPFLELSLLQRCVDYTVSFAQLSTVHCDGNILLFPLPSTRISFNLHLFVAFCFLLGLVLFLICVICFSYNGAITKCVTAIIVLQKRCKEFHSDQAQSTGAQASVVMGPPRVPALHGPGTGYSPPSLSKETEKEVG